MPTASSNHADGTILYKLKRRYRDGSTHVVFTPHSLIERLCALIPRPRRKLVTYYGVFAPAASLRDCIVPGPVEEHPPQPAETEPPDDAVQRLGIGRKPVATIPHAPSRAGPRKAYTWAELLQRVFLIEILTCPHCQGPRRLLALVFDPEAIERILSSLGLPTEPPEIAPARPPPHQRLPW